VLDGRLRQPDEGPDVPAAARGLNAASGRRGRRAPWRSSESTWEARSRTQCF
jgi:hypothetical protein